MATKRVQNWARTLSWTPDELHEPTDEARIATLIRRAMEQGQRLKPIGSALSWSDIIDMPQAALQLTEMSRVLDVDPETHRIRLQAGAVLRDVNEALAARGLAFDNFGSIVLQTAGGYTGSGTHGTGGRTKILSNDIVSMRLIDGVGELHELDAEHEPELFRAARVHLGCLGVVSELTFRCVDAFDLEERLELQPFDTVLANLEPLVAENDYLKLWWLPYTDSIQVYRFNRTDKPRTGFSVNEWLDTSGVSARAFSGLLAFSRAVPRSIRRLHDTIQAIQFRPHVRVDRSDKIIRYAGTIPNHQETEYAVPMSRAAEAIERTRQMVLAAKHYRVNFPLEVRFVAGDEIPMSPATGRDVCYIGPYIASLEWAPRYFADFEEWIGDFEGRPHWGKTFNRTSEQLRAVYPEYDAFNELRASCDPHGIFRNSFVDRVFGLGDTAG